MLKDPELAAAYDDTMSMLIARTGTDLHDRDVHRLCFTLCLMLRVLDKLAQEAEALRIELKGHREEHPYFR